MDTSSILSPFPTGYLSRGPTKFLQISSINYDYVPMNLDGPKVLWLDLKHSPPSDLEVGTPIRLHIHPFKGLSGKQQNSIFEIQDIHGSRVVLLPYRGTKWLPTFHSRCDSPFGWGYDMRRANVAPSMHNTKFGYGIPVSYIEYLPSRFDEKPVMAEIVAMERAIHQLDGTVPGWPYQYN